MGEEEIAEYYLRLGANLRKYRIESGETLETLSFLLGISRPALTMMELGKQKFPTHLINTACIYLRIKPKQLLPA
jgi:transcriptional regulator with XRE-family HTH domain